jgi:hypothetical protein
MGELTVVEAAFLAVMIAIASYAAGWLRAIGQCNDAFFRGLEEGRRIWKPHVGQPDAGEEGKK